VGEHNLLCERANEDLPVIGCEVETSGFGGWGKPRFDSHSEDDVIEIITFAWDVDSEWLSTHDVIEDGLSRQSPRGEIAIEKDCRCGHRSVLN